MYLFYDPQAGLSLLRLFGAGGTVTQTANSSPVEGGYILISLQKPGDSHYSLYHFNPSTSRFSRSVTYLLTPRSSAADDAIVGISAPKNATAGTSLGVWSIGRDDVTPKLLYTFPTSDQPWFPALSTDGLVVTDVLSADNVPADGAAAIPPNSWNIILVGTSSSDTYTIAKGLYPQWGPGDDLLYLANDGLHEYSLSTGSDTMAWKMLGGMTSSLMSFAVSRDGTRIAWTDPSHGVLVLAVVESWDPFFVDEIRSVPITALWPVFSPSGNSVAVEQVDNLQSTTSTSSGNPRISLVGFDSGDITQLQSLAGFEQSSIILSDWNSAMKL
jgi:hypothetical protein